jgi:hypothetical protein
MVPTCGNFVLPVAFGILIAGNVWLVRRYARLARLRCKGTMTLKYVYPNLLTRDSMKWRDLGRPTPNYLLPLDARDRRVFDVIKSNLTRRVAGFSVAYWVFVMLAWGLLQKSCSA